MNIDNYGLRETIDIVLNEHESNIDIKTLNNLVVLMREVKDTQLVAQIYAEFFDNNNFEVMTHAQLAVWAILRTRLAIDRRVKEDGGISL